MVRTIYVVFVESELSNTSGLKRYMFLCPYNCVKEGDIIKDPRYLSLMKVVAIDNCSSRVQERITLKDIQIETLNGKPLLYNDFHINQQRNEMKNKWLRDVHKLIINVVAKDDNIWTYILGPMEGSINIDEDYKDYLTYEEALEEGLKQVLKFI